MRAGADSSAGPRPDVFAPASGACRSPAIRAEAASPVTLAATAAPPDSGGEPDTRSAVQHSGSAGRISSGTSRSEQDTHSCG
jgi:hypothetical protein